MVLVSLSSRRVEKKEKSAGRVAGVQRIHARTWQGRVKKRLLLLRGYLRYGMRSGLRVTEKKREEIAKVKPTSQEINIKGQRKKDGRRGKEKKFK